MNFKAYLKLTEEETPDIRNSQMADAKIYQLAKMLKANPSGDCGSLKAALEAIRNSTNPEAHISAVKIGMAALKACNDYKKAHQGTFSSARAPVSDWK